MSIQFNRISKDSKNVKLDKLPDQLKIAKESGAVIGIASNQQINRSNHKGKRKRRANTHRVPEDWNREYRNAKACIDNNFRDHDPNCYYVVAHISNKHIKSIKKAREYVHGFEKGLPNGSIVLAFIELNTNHHPHVHMLIRNHQKSLSDSILRSAWTYGSISSIRRGPDHLRDKILNYSIKRYSATDKLVFNKEQANKYQRRLKKLQYIIRELKKKRSGLEGNKKVRCRKLIDEAYHLKRKYKRSLKAENQKQVLVKDRPVYKTRGMGQNKYQIVTDPSKIRTQLQEVSPVSKTITELTSYENTTGELIGKPIVIEKVLFR